MCAQLARQRRRYLHGSSQPALLLLLPGCCLGAGQSPGLLPLAAPGLQPHGLGLLLRGVGRERGDCAPLQPLRA